MSNIYLSKNANKLLQDYLIGLGHNLILIHDTGLVYPQVATHADIYMCKLGSKPDSPLFKVLNEPNTDLGYNYPQNVKYNAVCMGKYFIHNLAATSPSLLQKAYDLNLIKINVKQGYTKCNMVVINDRFAITADQGIYDSINNFFLKHEDYKSKIHILLVKSGHVKLAGFPYGFLGGASGRVGNEIIFNGNLKEHPDFDAICEFVTAQNLRIKFFQEYPLEDIGSIIMESTKQHK